MSKYVQYVRWEAKRLYARMECQDESQTRIQIGVAMGRVARVRVG